MARNQPGVRIEFDDLDSDVTWNPDPEWGEAAERYNKQRQEEYAAQMQREQDEIDFSNRNYRSWPAAVANPEAAVGMILRNYGKDKKPMYQTERDMNYLRELHPDQYYAGDILDGFIADPAMDFYTKKEYDYISEIAKEAYEGNGDAAETLNRLISRSNEYYINRTKRK